MNGDPTAKLAASIPPSNRTLVGQSGYEGQIDQRKPIAGTPVSTDRWLPNW
jgi:hypothetical protein